MKNFLLLMKLTKKYKHFFIIGAQRSATTFLKKQLNKVGELLQEETELELALVAEKDLPSEITGKQLASIALIIK